MVPAWIGPGRSLTVVADADGLGPDWVELKEPPDKELVLQLVDDSVPISGRILFTSRAVPSSA